MRSIREKKKWVEDYQTSKSLIDDLEVLYEFHKAGDVSIDEVELQFSKASDFVFEYVNGSSHTVRGMPLISLLSALRDLDVIGLE